jgi:predicted nucleic acid-binding protein
MVGNPVLLYWDTSALISALLEDEHTEKALSWLRTNGDHLISSLAFAEVQAVLQRVQRESNMPNLVKKVQAELQAGPWKRLNLLPEWSLFQVLAKKWSLRGADLWHLAMAKTVAHRFPELRVLSFDRRLSEAARGEGFAA